MNENEQNSLIETLTKHTGELRTENQRLRDENYRLRGDNDRLRHLFKEDAIGLGVSYVFDKAREMIKGS